MEALKETVSAQLEITAAGINMNFTELQEKVNKDTAGANEQLNVINKYIHFNNGTIEIGEQGNGLTEVIPLGDTVGDTKTITRWKIPESFAGVINSSSKIGVATLECKTYDSFSGCLFFLQTTAFTNSHYIRTSEMSSFYKKFYSIFKRFLHASYSVLLIFLSSKRAINIAFIYSFSNSLFSCFAYSF